MIDRVGLMKEKILFTINAFWSAIMAFSVPICLGIIIEFEVVEFFGIYMP